ncbi:DUF4843 domain-containing protein [Flavivirga spongiicola]|uniref:DUF4843 domain-containing protein n=1 Tax=Flavivirga spongiicola TaxID=421621 RepID=A0ABU7XQJ9_9FLAO|nr:DUF4843 domain-containing protein [Flavivirga sp. MEBiC05379]MDO5977850.1 DUF4843 domain-containing protein [Flavivirga sp. MEBiC05379]
MQKYIKSIILICTIVFAFSACEKEEPALFSGKDVVYFQWAKEGQNGFGSDQVDSLSLSFALELPTVTDSIFNIPVKVHGYTANSDRTIGVRVHEASTAQGSVHFSIPDNVVIPADSVGGFIPVTVNRTADMKDQPFLLKLQLVSNENFETNLTGTILSSNANRPVSYDEFELLISDILTEPSKWSSLAGWLGPFSAKKLYLIAELNDIPVPNYNEFPPFGEFLSHIRVLKQHLEDQKANGTPVLEDDGSEMIVGPYA